MCLCWKLFCHVSSSAKSQFALLLQTWITNADDKWIFVASFFSETSEPAYQDIHVRRVVIHIDYHSGTLRNDIALLILDQPVIMTGYIRPVCLPPAIDFTGLTCTVTGWGKNNPGGQFSNKLKEVDVPVMDNERCQNTLRTAPELGPVFNLHNSFLCAGMPGKDACSVSYHTFLQLSWWWKIIILGWWRKPVGVQSWRCLPASRYSITR